MTRVLLYSPANLNIMDGSSIWVQSVAETLAADPSVQLVLPLKAPERRDLITGALRDRPGIELLEPTTFQKRVRPSGLGIDAALDWIEHLDREQRFDVFILRSFELCLAAALRPRLRGRLWSTYILEPERDLGSTAYLADMAAITVASEFVVCQSEEMRQLLEQFVPAARSHTILIPPAIPPGVPRADPARPGRRLIYTGKFHPFYPVPDLIDAFVPLRERFGDIEFHVVGDKIWRTPEDHAYADALETRLGRTAGLVWHGAISRSAVADLLAGGGIALSIWDRRHGPRSNDLVVSTKLLDYCAASIPVVLNRTVAQEGILGEDYPLFVDGLDEVSPLLERLLGDAELYRRAADRCWAATRRFTYPVVVSRLRPFLARPLDSAAVAAALADRPKLDGAALTLGVRVDVTAEQAADPGAEAVRRTIAALALLRALLSVDDRFRLTILAGPDLSIGTGVRSVVEQDALLARATAIECNLDAAAWAMCMGWQVTDWDSSEATLDLAPGAAWCGIGGSLAVRLPDAGATPPSYGQLAAAIAGIVWSDDWEDKVAAARMRFPGPDATTSVESTRL